MDPSYVDENVTAFEVYNMISSQNDLSVDPSNQPGTSESARPSIPYQMYQLDTSPSTDFSSSSGGNRIPSPELLDAEDVEDYFNGNGFGYLPPEEIERQRVYDQERGNIQQQLLNTTLQTMANENLMIPPQAPMYPTPPLAEISPRAGNTASYHPQTAGSSYDQGYSRMTSPSQPSRSKRPRPSSPGPSHIESYPMQPLLPPQTPHSMHSSNLGVDFRLSPPFVPYEHHSWVPVYDERQQQMNPFTIFCHADRGLSYVDKQEAYVNYRKTHLQLQVNIECVDCEQGLVPKFIWYNSFIPIKEFQVQIHGVRHHNQTTAIPMKQSDKERKMQPAVYEGFEITETSTIHVLRRFHFSRATENNNQINGKPNPKQEFFDLVLRLVAVTADGNQYIIQSHVAQKIICRAQNPRTFLDHDDDRSIKDEVDDEDEPVHVQQTCWECGRSVISTSSQVVVGGHEPVEGAALTVRGDVVVGSIRTFCDERCKNVFKEKVDEELKEAYDQLKDLRIFEFSYKEEFAARMGLSPRKRDGFMAQQVREIIPEAVVEMGDFLSVDQAEIFIKSVSALKHLSSMAERMQGNLNETMKQVAYILETVNNKRKTKSMISGINSEAMSRRSSVSTTYSVETKRQRRRSPPTQQPYQDILCGSRFSQCTIISVVVMLVFVMAACLVSMTFLYFVDLTSRYGHNPIPTVFSPKKTPPENMVVPVNQLAHLQQNVSMLAPKCSGGHCHQYCCDRETIGNATAYMLRENVIVPMRDGEEQTHHFGPLPDMLILIPELNITLDKSFCVSQSCNKHRKQYRLFIPLSPSFPKAPLTVKFRLNSAKIVQLCGDVDGFRQKKCMKSINMEKRLVARQVDPSTFELPVGGYIQSGYKFHVSFSPDSCDFLVEDSSRSMEEFNLIFYRKCF